MLTDPTGGISAGGAGSLAGGMGGMGGGAMGMGEPSKAAASAAATGWIALRLLAGAVRLSSRRLEAAFVSEA